MARVTVEEGKGLKVDGTVVPLISGTLHYWRHPAGHWPSLLRSFKSLGLSIIETYIPWGVHEVSRRSFDFGGIDPDRNLERFIQLVHKAGLRMIVRPGPHINAELTDFGYPRRIVTDPEIVALEAHGGFSVMDAAPRPFGIPSYASEKFYRECAVWFDALAPLLKKHLHPQGPIIALQVDNETGYFFRTGAYTLDYHPDSLVWYRRFLMEKYGEICALNQAYGSQLASFDVVDPPRRFEGRCLSDLAYHLDWVLYKEWQILECLRRLKGMWHDRGVEGVPFYQNYFSPTSTPYDLAATEGEACGLEIAGVDDYSRRDAWRHHAWKCLFLSGTSRLPYVPEFGAGSWAFPPWAMALEENDTRFTAPFFFMFGVKAMNHYMAVERDRWMGSPISAQGEMRKPLSTFHRDFNAFLKSSRLNELSLQADLLLMANRDADRLRTALSLADGHSGHPFPPGASLSDVELPFAHLPQEDHAARLEALHEFALFHRLPYHASDTSLSYERMRGHKAILVPTYGFMERSAQERLRRFVEEGGSALIGPDAPGLDGDLKPFTVFSAYQAGEAMTLGKGRLLLLEAWDEEKAAAFLASAGVLPLMPTFPKGVLVTRHVGDAGEVIFLANPSDAEVVLPAPEEAEGRNWIPLWGAKKTWKAGKGVVLPPWTVTAWQPEGKKGAA